jgi:hypothetical protein
MPFDESSLETTLTTLMILSTIALTWYHIREFRDADPGSRIKRFLSVVLLVILMVGEVAGKWNEHELKTTLGGVSRSVVTLQKAVQEAKDNLALIVVEAGKTQAKTIQSMAETTTAQLDSVQRGVADLGTKVPATLVDLFKTQLTTAEVKSAMQDAIATWRPSVTCKVSDPGFDEVAQQLHQVSRQQGRLSDSLKQNTSDMKTGFAQVSNVNAALGSLQADLKSLATDPSLPTINKTLASVESEVHGIPSKVWTVKKTDVGEAMDGLYIKEINDNLNLKYNSLVSSLGTSNTQEVCDEARAWLGDKKVKSHLHKCSASDKVSPQKASSISSAEAVAEITHHP